jgi:hypothetical protein
MGTYRGLACLVSANDTQVFNQKDYKKNHTVKQSAFRMNAPHYYLIDGFLSPTESLPQLGGAGRLFFSSHKDRLLLFYGCCDLNSGHIEDIKNEKGPKKIC